jgi:uncharacterized protein YdeI (YjbR/CyaY-like superfamily)
VTPSRPGAAALPVLLFEDQDAWAAWLDEHHAGAPGVWLRLAKKNAALRSLPYAEALDVALCYGWIDSQKKSHDESSWLQKFTPRGPKSLWSKINCEKVRALSDAGRMRPAGLRAVEQAQADGRWDAAYDSQRTASVPADLAAALEGNAAAKAFFSALDGANRYAVLFRVQTATTPAARAKRIAALVAMLARGEKIHG